jgi:predicted Zn-dependent peptidase
MKYKKKILSNGLRIITIPMKDSETAIAMVLVETGSEYEEKEINGLSHFLEHMCFKGTKNRTGEQINYEFACLGAQNNAFTGDVYTGYYGKARYEKINNLIDIVSDMYTNPLFPEKDIETERGVILEEMNMYKDLPMRKIHSVYGELLYGDQPAGREIIGTVKNLKSFKRDDFVKYHSKHYVPQKTVVIVAGKIKESSIYKEIKNKFGSISKGEIYKKPKTVINQKSPALKIVKKKIDQTHILVGFHSFDLYDKRNPILDVAATVLGSGMSSRLFRKMRNEMGVCYYVGAGNDTSIDHGDFTVRIGATNNRAVESVKVILEELKRLRDEKISEKELNKAKDIILGKMANNMETSEDLAHYYGGQELCREKILTPEEYSKKIKSVTASQIQKVLKQVIRNEHLNLAIIGPQNNNKSFSQILKL